MWACAGFVNYGSLCMVSAPACACARAVLGQCTGRRQYTGGGEADGGGGNGEGGDGGLGEGDSSGLGEGKDGELEARSAGNHCGGQASGWLISTSLLATLGSIMCGSRAAPKAAATPMSTSARKRDASFFACVG